MIWNPVANSIDETYAANSKDRKAGYVAGEQFYNICNVKSYARPKSIVDSHSLDF